MVKNVSKQMQSVILRVLVNLHPEIYYTAGDIIHHARNVDSRADNLDARNVSRYMCVLKNEGFVTMHNAGIKDDSGTRTKSRTFKVVNE